MRAALVVALLLPVEARADSHSVTIHNGTGETIRSVAMAPAGSAGPGENRMRSLLPPNADARITYSTGCRADIRLGFEGGRTEDHKDVDVCADPRIVAGTEGVAGPAGAAHAAAAPRAGVNGRAAPVPVIPVAKGPAVPPWTGKSITKHFGGMD